MPKPPYAIVYDSALLTHLDAIDRKDHSAIRRAIETMLTHEPENESRNRKPLVRPSSLGVAWELRCGKDNRFRVFYRTETLRREVRVLAIGVKLGNRLSVGGKEFDL